MEFKIELTGLENVASFLERLSGEVPREAGAALKEIYEEDVMAPSQRIVPLDVGTLKNSRFVEEPKISADGTISVTGGYGGAASDYAIVQHEDLSLNHQGQGRPKYLETPLLEAKPKLAANMARRLKARLGR
jgi:hypothetical protein